MLLCAWSVSECCWVSQCNCKYWLYCTRIVWHHCNATVSIDCSDISVPCFIFYSYSYSIPRGQFQLLFYSSYFKAAYFQLQFQFQLLRCLNLSSTSSFSSSNNKINKCNLSAQYFVALLYYSQISQYALYIENTVHTLCKIWNPRITSTVLQNKNIENSVLRVLSCKTRILKTVRNDLCSQAAL